MAAVQLGIIGAGRWGTNYLRTLDGLKGVTVRWFCATRESSLKKCVEKAKPTAVPKFSTDYHDVLADSAVNAVAVVTPGSTLYALAKEALLAGKHVLVEKPVAFHVSEVKELVKLSKEKNLILMAGYIHRFNPAILKLKQDIATGKFGKIQYIQSFGSGNGPVRTDMSALWDYCPHDVSILLYLLDEMPRSVSASGTAYLKPGIEDVVTMQLTFPSGIFATVFGSWLHPLKQRGLVVVGEKLSATFDDYAEQKLRYSGPDGVTTPKLDSAMPLTEELKHFIGCIRGHKQPITSGEAALDVVRVLESAQQSIRTGKPVAITP